MQMFFQRVMFSLPLRYQFERKFAFARAFNFIYFNKIVGNYVEFGVASGMTMKFAIRNAAVRKLNQMKFIGIDTFEGFPETAGPETAFKTYGSITGSRAFSIAHLTKLLNPRNKYNLSLVKTNMEDNLGVENIDINIGEKIALLHLDMDYYLPTLRALELVVQNLQVGTIILSDNYNFFGANDTMGERRALLEFRNSSKSIIFSDLFDYGWHGKAFVISNIQNIENSSRE